MKTLTTVRGRPMASLFPYEDVMRLHRVQR
jgi:hypothetical protein